MNDYRLLMPAIVCVVLTCVMIYAAGALFMRMVLP